LIANSRVIQEVFAELSGLHCKRITLFCLEAISCPERFSRAAALLFVESIKRAQFHEEKRNAVQGWRLELELETYEPNSSIKPLFSFLSARPS